MSAADVAREAVSRLHLDDQSDGELAEPASLFERDVEAKAYDLRVLEAARDKVGAEKAAAETVPPFDDGLLADVLARPAEPPHRVESLIPSEAGTLVVAQRKTGKTTWQLNLARSLILGGRFLGRFEVRPVAGRVGLLNFEVSAAQLARWAHESGVPDDRLYLVNLRGRRNPFNLDADREHLAERLRAHEVESLIVDPFGRAYTGKSQNDPGEVGAWLADLDRFARGDAGIADVILAAHAGWDGERTRGASALEDWADVVVTLVRGRDDGQERYLRAEGRDVLIEEDRLDYDAATRTLTLAGAGSRKSAAKVRQVEALMPAVIELLRETPLMSGNQLDGAIKSLIVSGDLEAKHSKGDGARAAQLLERRSLVASKDGPRGARLFTLLVGPTSPTSPTSPDLPRGTSDDLPTSLIGGGHSGKTATAPPQPQGTLDLPGDS